MVVGDLPTATDIVVLGAGPGGYVAAIRAAQLGKQVVLVDPGPPGGTCLHEGCIPSKALLQAADRAYSLATLHTMGIHVSDVQIDWRAMQAWKQSVVQRLATGVRQLLDGNGVQIVQGRGWFLNDHEVRVEGEHGALRYSFERCIIAVGAEATPVPGLPFDGQRVLTPTEVLKLPDLPPSLAVVGASARAIEIATIFVKLGVAVRLLVPDGQRLLPEFDPGAGQAVQAQLKKLGVAIDTNSADLARATEQSDIVVVCAGLRPRTADLELGVAGVRTDPHGFIPADAQMCTSQPGIYAVGDVTGGPPLATVAIKQGKVAAESCADMLTQYAPQAVPRVAWTDPEIVSVGMSTEEAIAIGYEVTTGRFPFAANGRALTIEAAEGAAITVAEHHSGVLLGITIVGARASEIVGEAALALEMGATLTDLAETLHPHPGLGEALQEAAEAALGAAVHVLGSRIAH